MKKSVRRVLFYIFVGAFCVLAPLTVLYTAGYRFSLQSGIDLDVGSLSVTSTPRRATISIRSDISEKRTPHVFQELSPGEYDITLTRDGFHPWSSALRIIPGLTTYIQNITLFRQERPNSLFSIEGSEELVDITDRLAAHVEIANEQYELVFSNANSGISRDRIVLDELPRSLEWSSTGNFLLVRFTDHFTVYSDSAESIADSREFIDSPITSVVFDVRNPSQLITQDDSDLSYLIDINDVRILTSTPYAILSSFDSQSVLALEQLFTSTVIHRINLEGEKSTFAVLPRSNYTALTHANEFFILRDSQSDFYIVHDATRSTTSLDASSALFSWNRNSSQMAYIDGPDLNIITPSQQQRDMLLRLSSDIGAIEWHSGGQRILYTTSEGLFAIDAYLYGDSRDIVQLSDLSDIKDFWIDRRGRFAFILHGGDEDLTLSELRLR